MTIAHAGTLRLTIAAWWIPHPGQSARCVLLLHGYADGKVGALAWAPTWQALGYNICAIDLRAHGYSGGRYTTAGFFERQDVNQIIDELRAAHPNETRHFVLFGVSLGAAIALAAADAREAQEDIDALVLESPFADYRRPIAAHARMLGMPLPSLLPATIRMAEWISGANFDQVRPIDLLVRVRQPVLTIHPEFDPFVSQDDEHQFERVMFECAERGLNSARWLVARTAHNTSIVADPNAYRERIREFLAMVRQRETVQRRARHAITARRLPRGSSLLM